ncbi:MAG: ATP-binding protein [Bacteroidota bacterium]
MAIKVSLRLRLTFWYSTIVVLSLTAFGVYTYISVSNKLHSNLDASLVNVALTLDYIIKQNTIESLKPSKSLWRTKRIDGEPDKFALFREDERRRFVGPLRPVKKANVKEAEKDIVWSAIFEHILLDPKNYYIQIADTNNQIVWRSRNLKSDSLPVLMVESQGTDSTTSNKNDTAKKLAYYLPSGVDSVFTSINVDKQEVRLLIKKTENAVVSIGYTAEVIENQLKDTFLSLILAFPLILIASISGGMFLSKFSLRLVDEITQSAHEITAKHLSKRLPETHIDDEIGRLTRTLNEMIERLENSFAQIKRFTSDASHELRTPLTILRGELEVALHSTKTEEQYEEIIISALEEVERLSNVVETLLELSRAETGQVKMNFELQDLAKLINDISEDAETLSENRNINVFKNIEQNVLCKFDSARIHQAVLNIVDNAVKYTPSGGSITIELKQSKDYYEIIVSDTGMGMDEEDLNHIFDRFYRVDKARSSDIQGIGLGLSIVNWIIEAHRGKILVNSKLNEGTAFTLLIPKNL